MTISKALLNELKTILKEEYNVQLSHREIENLGYTLAGLFDLLLKIDSKKRFVNSSSRVIEKCRKGGIDKLV